MNAPAGGSRGHKQVEQEPAGDEKDNSVLPSKQACHKHMQAPTKVDLVGKHVTSIIYQKICYPIPGGDVGHINSDQSMARICSIQGLKKSKQVQFIPVSRTEQVMEEAYLVPDSQADQKGKERNGHSLIAIKELRPKQWNLSGDLS
ncbi:unnamed protein product [Prunus armeniaca]